ncbi:transcriptional regulator MntR [Candidatus Acetothermia bacterium]|nr:transcriptional regulator MntR [Candidatus Acetothermia bacterium]MBI3659292.1 transcriptional regulator MntR [Candidatus Acetothermia bacterium]
MPTPSVEDYLERIYELIQEKGYARVIDIASSLGIQSSSVTKMIQKLSEQEFLVYEKYRGLTLTPKGESIAQSVKSRHRKLEEFLRILGVAEGIIQKDIEGLEHYLSPETLQCIRDFVEFVQAHPDWQTRFKKYRQTEKNSR